MPPSIMVSILDIPIRSFSEFRLAQMKQGQRVRIPYNIGFSDALGIEVNASNEFTDWYRVSGNFNFYRQETVVPWEIVSILEPQQ